MADEQVRYEKQKSVQVVSQNGRIKWLDNTAHL